MSVERVVKWLPVKLTEDEVLARLKRAAELAGEEDDRAAAVESAKERAKSLVKEAEAQLTAKREERSKVSRIARERCEYRDVPCEERLVRARRQRVVVRLDTLEELEPHPASDEEMRKGARWKPNYAAKRSELAHPDEPETVLDTRALTEAEKQVPLPGADGQVKATTLAEAAAIAAARENGDLPHFVGGVEVKLPPSEGEPYESKGPATTVTSEQLDKLTPVEAKPESKAPDLAGLGIEQRPVPSNDNGAPAAPTTTVFVLSLEESARKESRALSAFDWLPDAAGTQLESELLDADEAKHLRASAAKAGVVVRERAVSGRPSETHFRASALRSAYDALSEEDKDAVGEVRCDGAFLPGSWDDVSVGEHITYEGTLSADQLEALKIAGGAVGLEVSSEPVMQYPCSEPGCTTWETRGLLNGGGGVCGGHLSARAALKDQLAGKSKPSKKGAAKKEKPRSVEQLEELVAKRTSELNATKNAHALGLVWRSVVDLKLPDAHHARLEGVFDGKAKRMGLSATTLEEMRRNGEAPAAPPTEQTASA